MPSNYRTYTLKATDEQLEPFDAIIEFFDGNTSMALRRLFALGLAAWNQGARAADDVELTPPQLAY